MEDPKGRTGPQLGQYPAPGPYPQQGPYQAGYPAGVPPNAPYGGYPGGAGAAPYFAPGACPPPSVVCMAKEFLSMGMLALI